MWRSGSCSKSSCSHSWFQTLRWKNKNNSASLKKKKNTQRWEVRSELQFPESIAAEEINSVKFQSVHVEISLI